METVRQAVDLIRQNPSAVGLAFTWIGIIWVYLRKRSAFARKHFGEQVNFSLNYVRDGRLVMRTLLETSAREVWINDHGVSRVNRAVRRTTAARPFVELPDPADMAFIHRAVLNVLSEKFADAYLAEAMGLPARFVTCRFAITFERHDDMRTYKLRVLVVREDELDTDFEALLDAEDRPIYKARLKTLIALRDLHKSAGKPGVVPLGRVVLGLRA